MAQGLLVILGYEETMHLSRIFWIPAELYENKITLQ